MQFLNPYAIAWVPVIALLLLVARHRSPRPRRAVGNLYMWRQSKPVDPARIALARFRRHRLLALQIAFMAVVIAALARPAINRSLGSTASNGSIAATGSAQSIQPADWSRRPASAKATAVRRSFSEGGSTDAKADPIRVLLLTRGSFFLEQSLAANPSVSVDREPRTAVRYDVVVCDACDRSPAVDAGLLTIPAPEAPSPPAQRLTVSDLDHPIGAALSSIATESVLAIPASRSVRSTIPGDVVLRVGGIPALVATVDRGGRTVELNVDLAASPLPLSTAFPILMANVIEWLAARDPASATLNAAMRVEPAPPDRPAFDTTELWRLFLLMALALLVVEWRYWSGRERTRPALVCRAIVMTLTALAAIGLRVPIGDAREAVMFVLDRSGSLPPATQAAAVTRMNVLTTGMRSGDRAGLVVFGLDAALERSLGNAPKVSEITSTVSPAGTNLEAALRTARAALPHDGGRRIVLISDGRATIGDVSREIARATAGRIPIDTVAADAAAADRPLIVKSVAAPSDVRVGEPFVVSAEIAGPPGARARLTLTSDDRSILERDVEVTPDGTAGATFTDQRPQAGMYTYRAALDNEEPAVGATVTVAGVPQILYVSASSGVLPSLLTSAGFLVRHVTPGEVASISADLVRYDAIVVDDVPADRVGAKAADAIAYYVEQTGGGLLLLGSPQSLDASGYPEGPLGRLLPVDLHPRAGQRSPAMGLVVAFDKSGSMADLVSGVAKIELARQAVKNVVNAVRPTDPIGVVAFDAAPVVVSTLAAAPDPQRLAESLRAINPSGSTAIAPAMSQAAEWLRRANVTRRHVLLVSDGRTTPADAERLRTTVRDGGFELSVIAIGADADRLFLEELARATGGRAYFPEDLRQLPILAAREAARAAGGGVVQEPFALRAAPHPIASGLDRAGLPTMRGYVVSAAKSGAEAVLLSHLDDPLLAAWRFGLGRVAVYTADLQSPWSLGLRRWSGFAPLWQQTARWLTRSAANRALQASVVERPDGAHLVVEAEDPSGNPLDRADVRATVRGPNGDEQSVTLVSIDSGRYEAAIATPSPGSYVASVSARSHDSSADRSILRGFYWSANRERRATGADMATLTQITRSTGGRVLGPNDDPFTGPRPRAFREVWTFLAAAALLLFPIDVALRRGLSFRRRADSNGIGAPSRAAA